MKNNFKWVALLLGFLGCLQVQAADQFRKADTQLIALSPVQNANRNKMDISGIWSFKTDPQNVGENQQWFNGLTDAVNIAVPGSWNDQIEGLHNYLGTAWYETETFIPQSWKTEKIYIRIGSASYAAKVWVNGKPAGMHEGGNLPFAFEISSLVKYGQPNVISVQVENELKPTRIPTGNLGGASMMSNIPASNYDFFPYSGIHRNVVLYTVPRAASISDVTCTTGYEGNTGFIQAKVQKSGNAQGGKLTVSDQEGHTFTATFKFAGNEAAAKVEIPDVHLWNVGKPYLYNVQVELTAGSKVLDSYALQTGVRTVSVTANEVLVNGEPVKMKGFGKHEDFIIFGRGVALPVTVRDYELMKWIGANSFRTSHYPYDDNVYDIADRMGFLVIDEIPSVGLLFHDGDENVKARQKQCRYCLEEMINRDKNHPSVIMWSVANEPTFKGVGQSGMAGMATSAVQGGKTENEIAIECLGELVKLAKTQDPTRPATFVAMSGTPESWMQVGDVMCLNRYYGWYAFMGDFEKSAQVFVGEMDQLHGKYNKPIIITEFGADTNAGFHSADALAFSEEFQCKMLEMYLNQANTRNFVAGMQVWNFADFQTGQGLIRANSINQKGVFTRDRQPKMAAHLLHQRWTTTDKY